MKHKIIDKLREKISPENFPDNMSDLHDSLKRVNISVEEAKQIITDLTKQGEPEDNPVGKMVGMSKNCDNTFVSIQIFDSYKSIDFQRGDYFYIRPQASYEMEEILKELSRLTASPSPQGVDFGSLYDEVNSYYDIKCGFNLDKDKFIEIGNKYLSPAPNTELLRDKWDKKIEQAIEDASVKTDSILGCDVYLIKMDSIITKLKNEGVNVEKNKVDFRNFQNEVACWAEHNFGRSRNRLHPLLGVSEEVGELNHAILKLEQGIRGDKKTHLLEAEDAIGDIIIYLADFCNLYGFDLTQCINYAWETASKRDWVKYPKNGLNE